MRRRSWIPVALLFVVLIGGTAAVGYLLRNQLDDAARVLDPVVDPSLADQLESSDDLGVPVCGDEAVVAAELRRFHEAVGQLRSETSGAATPVLTVTPASFDSFLLRSATARLAAGPYSLLVRARQADGRWCVDDAQFATEE